MTADSKLPRTNLYKPALAWFAAFGTFWVFVLVILGAFTTSIGAGMVFADWPLSNGSLNPPGWMDDLAMFAEHSHRLSAGVMSAVTIILAVWIWRVEQRAWLRRLAVFAVGLVLVQATVGGLRVLLDHLHIAMVDTSVGRLFAMLHACLAQLFVCTLIAITVSCTRGWINSGEVGHDNARRAGVICCALLFIQLGVAAVMRHSFAGLAIPTFPYSTPDGGLLPETWNFRIAIHFAHRAMAVVLAGALTWFAYKLWIDPKTSAGLRIGALTLVGLLTSQIILGAQIIWTHRSAATTTGHVAVGALTLAVTFCLTWVASRTLIERRHGS